MRTKASRLVLGIFLAFACWAVALAAEMPQQPGAKPAALAQVGVIDALLAGGYEGSLSLGELRKLGDFGLGTFDALDGEMVVLDGVVYQVPASGQVRKAPDTLTTPFAQVTRFAPGATCALPAGADLKAVEAKLDAALGDPNCFAAVRIDADFASLTARSVPRQTPPYRPLSVVAKDQAVFPSPPRAAPWSACAAPPLRAAWACPAGIGIFSPRTARAAGMSWPSPWAPRQWPACSACAVWS